MRNLLIALLAVLFWTAAVPAQAQVAFVKSAIAGAVDDPVVDFGSATSASNSIVAFVSLGNTNNLDVLTVSETVLHEVADYGTVRFLMVCFPGGSQTYTFQSHSSGTVRVAAAEFSGLDGCTEMGVSDDTSTGSAVSGPLSSDSPPTINSGSLVFAGVKSANTGNFSCDTAGGYACIPADQSEVGDQMQAQWLVAPSTTTYGAQFTWSGTENVIHFVVGVAAASTGSGCGRRGLLRVGC
jgi:hypothetical protein